MLLLEQHGRGRELVYDIGCGPGVMSFLAARVAQRVVGYDASQEMIAICRSQQEISGLGNLEFHVRPFPFEENPPPCDLLMASSVFEYVEDLEVSFGAAASLLKEGGVLLFSMPNADSIYRKYEGFMARFSSRAGEYYRHVKHLLTLEQGVALASRHGLEVLEFHYYAHFYGLTKLIRALSSERRGNNLFVLVCRKPED